MSHDLAAVLGNNSPMDQAQPLSEFERDFIARTRAARKKRFKSQQALCDVLSIDQGLYKHYETHRLLPVELLWRFIQACEVDPKWMLSGRGNGPAVEPLPAPRERAPKKPRRKAA